MNPKLPRTKAAQIVGNCREARLVFRRASPRRMLVYRPMVQLQAFSCRWRLRELGIRRKDVQTRAVEPGTGRASRKDRMMDWVVGESEKRRDSAYFISFGICGFIPWQAVRDMQIAVVECQFALDGNIPNPNPNPNPVFTVNHNA